MNKYFLANFHGSKPDPSTDSATTKRFINDKYVNKKWVDEDEESPVDLFREGGKKKSKSKKSEALESSEEEGEVVSEGELELEGDGHPTWCMW